MGGAVNKVVEVGSLGLIKDATGADAAASAAKKAAGTQAAYQQQALDYLKQTERLPQEIREAALTRLAGFYGIPLTDAEGEPIDTGDPLATQAERIKLAQESPYYQQLMGARESGEEAIMRQAGMTGGLRSGNVQSALYDYNTQLQQKALTDAYNQQIAEENRMLQGLGGLGQLPSLAGSIAQGTAGIGQTLAQGQIGAQQSAAAANQAMLNTGLNAAALAAFMGSDRRLKENIQQIGRKNGFNWYRWTWNEAGRELGYDGESEGVMAQEVQQTRPDAVAVINGYLAVNYSALGVQRD